MTDFSGTPGGAAELLAGHFRLAADFRLPVEAEVEAGVPLVPPGGRLSALLLDVGLAVITLGAGWLVWSLITWRAGQTPGKRLMGHVVADASTGVPLNWGRMALREIVVRALLGAVLGLATASVFLLADASMVFSDGHRTLHDRLAGSIVRYR